MLEINSRGISEGEVFQHRHFPHFVSVFDKLCYPEQLKDYTPGEKLLVRIQRTSYQAPDEWQRKVSVSIGMMNPIVLYQITFTKEQVDEWETIYEGLSKYLALGCLVPPTVRSWDGKGDVRFQADILLFCKKVLKHID